MLREACLREQYAPLYPSLRAGVWYTAAAAAGHVVANRILHEGPGLELRDRELDPEHFIFRGSNARRGSWVGLRTRRWDRHAGSRVHRGHASLATTGHGLQPAS